MANVFDIGLLKDFSYIFGYLLIFVVVYGVLQITDIFKSRGIHALVAVAVTVLIATTSGSIDVITELTPWFVITGFFLVFLLVLTNFMGIPTVEVIGRFGGKGAVWWVFVPLIIGLVIALVSGGQLSRGSTTTHIDPETGQVITTPGKTVVNTLTDPKVLGFILILAISSITISLMAGVPKPGG